MSDFNELAKATLSDLQGFITTEFKNQSQEAVADAKAFLEASKDDLERWISLLRSGQLTPDDLGWLVKGRKDLAKMQALKQAGIALARLQKFQGQLLTAATNAALNLASAGLSQVTASVLPATRGGAPAAVAAKAKKSKPVAKAKAAPSTSKAKARR